MLNATIKESPVFGGKVKSFDGAKVAGMPGVKKVLQVGDTAVAVVADTWWQAKTALDALPIVWDEGPHAKVSSATIAETLKEGLNAEQAFVGNQNGDVKAAIASAAKKVEAVYSYPYQNHVCMEPMNATARSRPTSGECGSRRRTARPRSRRRSPHQACGDKCEVHMLTSAAALVGAVRSRTMCIRRSTSPSRCPARRSSSLVARGRHGAGPVPSGHDGQDDRRVRQGQNLTGLHIRLSGQSILASVRRRWWRQGEGGGDPLTFPGLFPNWRAFVQLQRSRTC